MSFAQPIWLSLTPILLLLFGGMVAYGLRRRDALLSHFAASRLLSQLTEQASLSRTWIKAACILLAVLALSVALARPQVGVEWTERKARGLDIVFVLDSSKSMLASDMRPSRLERAKLAVLDLLQRLESDRVGLVAFAGQAFLQTPPTLDYAAFRESLDAVDPNIMTSGGSDLGNAIREAADAFPSEKNVKVVVLLTDGEDLGGHAEQAAELAHKSGIQIFAIGIGTPEGAYLRIPNEQGIGEFVRDADGQPVRSQLDEKTLQTIAQVTGGNYRRLSSDSLDELYRSVIATLPREERESELQEVRIERFQWALATAIIFLVLEWFIRRRRSPSRSMALLCFAALAILPDEATAQSEGPADAREQYNTAYEALAAGEYANALEHYKTAIAQSDDLQLHADALYNMAHATHQLGRQQYEAGELEGALEQMKKSEDLFQSATELNPQDNDISTDLEQAARVREMVEQIIEQQKQQEQQSDQSQKSEDSTDSEDSKSSELDDQQPSGQESQQGDSSDKEPSQEGSQGESPKDSQETSGENSTSPSHDEQPGQSGESSEPADDSSQPNDSSSSSSDGQVNESEPQDSAEAAEAADASEPGESRNAPETGEPTSTQDPVDDIPAPQPDEPGEESDPSTAPQPASEGEAGDESAAQVGMGGETAQGMSEDDAAALLDSLRGREQLLPFNDASRTGRSRESRDW